MRPTSHEPQLLAIRVSSVRALIAPLGQFNTVHSVFTFCPTMILLVCIFWCYLYLTLNAILHYILFLPLILLPVVAYTSDGVNKIPCPLGYFGIPCMRATISCSLEMLL